MELSEVQSPRTRLGNRWCCSMAQWQQLGCCSCQHGLDTDPCHQRQCSTRYGASIADAAELAANEAEPQSYLNASSEYRTHLAKVLVRRALEEASN